MADETKGRPGDIIEIRVRKGGGAKPAPGLPPERRYGPPPFLEELRRRRKRGMSEVFFLNQQSEFSRVDPFRFRPKQELKYIHKWIANPLDFPAGGYLSLGKGTEVRRYFSSGAGDYVVYRDAWNKHPLPYQFAADYGVSFKLGGQTKVLAPATEQWKAYSPYDTRDDLLELQERGQDVTAELANNAYEIEEWEAAFRADKTYWVEFLRDHHRQWGFYRKRLSKQSTYSIESTGPCFEPFDPFDTDQYKVTLGSFASAEVAAPQLKSGVDNDVRFGLIPRAWSFTVNYTCWFFQFTFSFPVGRIWKRDFTIEGEAFAPTLPHIQPQSGALAPNEFPYQTSEWADGLFTGITTTDQMLDTTGLPAPSDTTYKFLKLAPFPEEEFDFTNAPESGGNSRWPIERSDCSISISERNIEPGELVGMFEVNGLSHNVFRKTTATRGAAVYSGDYNSPFGPGLAFVLVDFDDYINPSWQSLSRDYSYYDPHNLYLHV